MAKEPAAKLDSVVIASRAPSPPRRDDRAGVPLSGVGIGLRWEFLDEVLALADAPRVDGEEAPVDFFEVSPENYMRRGGYFPAALDRVRDRFPILTHGLTMSVGGIDRLDDDYMRELKRFVDRVGSPFHTDHLCFCGTRGRRVHDLLPLPRTREAVRHAASRVREIASRLERPFGVENISYYFAPGEAEMDDATFVAEVVNIAEAPLLFDVNNVYVNARNHGFDPVRYLDAIPWERVVQLHVAGHEHRPDEGLIIDTHGADVVSPVLELLERVVGRTGPLPVVLERDHDIPSWARLTEEVGRVRAAYRRGLDRFAAATGDVARGSRP